VRFYSAILRTHIALSELWDSAPAFAELQAIVGWQQCGVRRQHFCGPGGG